MAMAASDIEDMIKAALPDAKVVVEDLAGDGDHYAATVVSEKFRGMSRSAPAPTGIFSVAGPHGRQEFARSCLANVRAGIISGKRRFAAMSDVNDRIQTEIEASPVMLYMKGTPMFPQCGFSARVVQILTHMGVPFQSANVLWRTRSCARGQSSSRSGRRSRSCCMLKERVRRRLRHRQRDVPIRRAGRRCSRTAAFPSRRKLRQVARFGAGSDPALRWCS